MTGENLTHQRKLWNGKNTWKEILNGDNLFGLEFTVEQQKAEDISILKLIKSIGPMSANAVKLDETVDNLKMSLLILTKS